MTATLTGPATLGSVSRYDVRRAEVPRIPIDDQRPYDELFGQVAEYSILTAVVTDSADLLLGLADRLAADTLRLGNRDGSAA